MQIDIATRADDELYEAFQRLVPQMTQNNPPPTQGELEALINEPSSTLLLARADDGSIIGALNLTVYRVPTGIRSIIEDVIVETSARRNGVGQALVSRAIEIAREKGAGNISLTSNPMREAANNLYLKLGFQKRNTNAYQIKFSRMD